MDCKVGMQTHRASCEMAREENLIRRRRSRGRVSGAGPRWCRTGDGGFTHLEMDLCRGHIMASKNCAKVGLCSCQRQEMGSGRPRGVGREGVHCRQERSPTAIRKGRRN